MAPANRMPMSDMRKIGLAALIVVGVFLVCCGTGMSSVAVGSIGVVLAVGGPILILATTLRGNVRSYVFGTARVVEISPPPTVGPTGRGELGLVIHARGIDGVAVRIRDPAIPLNKWPQVNATLPVRSVSGSPRKTIVLWADVRTHEEATYDDRRNPEYADLSDQERDPTVREDGDFDHGPLPPDDTPTMSDIPPVPVSGPPTGGGEPGSAERPGSVAVAERRRRPSPRPSPRKPVHDEAVAVVAEPVAQAAAAPAAAAVGLAAEPQGLAAEPQDLLAEPLDVIAEPRDVLVEPPDVIAEPQDVIAEPQDVIAEPQDVIAEPQDVIAEPQDVIAEPQDVIGEAHDATVESQEAAVESREATVEPEDVEAERVDVEANAAAEPRAVAGDVVEAELIEVPAATETDAGNGAVAAAEATEVGPGTAAVERETDVAATAPPAAEPTTGFQAAVAEPKAAEPRAVEFDITPLAATARASTQAPTEQRAEAAAAGPDIATTAEPDTAPATSTTAEEDPHEAAFAALLAPLGPLKTDSPPEPSVIGPGDVEREIIAPNPYATDHYAPVPDPHPAGPRHRAPEPIDAFDAVPETDPADALEEEVQLGAIAEFLPATPQRRPVPLEGVNGVSVTLIVSDLQRSLRFYRETLGLSEVDSNGSSAVLASGDARVVLRRSADMPPVDRRVVHLNLEVPDVYEAYERLKAEGVEFVHRPRVVPQGEQLDLCTATFRDPDGHAISLTRWELRR